MNPKDYNNLKAISFMLLHAFAAASLLMLMKLLTKDIKSSQVVFFYKLLLLTIIVPWVLSNGSIKNLYTSRIRTYVIGSIFGTSATLCLMYGIKHVPLANATILGYLEKILLVAIGLFYYKEKVNSKKILAILFSFLGALTITVPYARTIEYFNSYYLFIFASVFLWVAYCITVKSLSATENIKTQTFYTIFFSALVACPVAFINWRLEDNMSFSYHIVSWQSIGLELKHMPILFLTAFCYLIVSVSFFKSMKHGDLAIITPFGYTKIIFAGLFGSIFFNEYPYIENLIGYCIIIASSWYLIQQSTLPKKQTLIS